MRIRDIELLIDGLHGRHVPALFVRRFLDVIRPPVRDPGLRWKGIDIDDMRVLACGPDHEAYDEAWDALIEKAIAVAPGAIYRLWQAPEGDLFLVSEEARWSLSGHPVPAPQEENRVFPG